MSTLRINEAYANKYNIWRGREELQKIASIRKRDGIESTDEEEDNEDESSSEESIDETSPEQNSAWYSTLEAIKRRDPKIYNSSERFFPVTSEQTAAHSPGSLSDSETGEKATRSKPLLLKDYQRKILLTMNPEEDGDGRSELGSNPTPGSTQPSTPRYYEQLESIWKGIRKTVHDHDTASRSTVKREGDGDDDDDDDEPFLVKKGSAPSLSDVNTASASSVAMKPETELVAPIKEETTSTPEIDLTRLDERDREALLYDFIFNRRYSDKAGVSSSASTSQLADAALGDRAALAKSVWEGTARHASTLRDIERFQNMDVAPDAGDDVGLSTDEEELEKQEEFEHQYNFRFEEPEAAKIRTYPRKIADSVRRDEHTSTRKLNRDRKKERQTLAKQKMRQEALHVLRTAESDEHPADEQQSNRPVQHAHSSSSLASRPASHQNSFEAEQKVKPDKKKGKKSAVEIADVELPFGYRKVQPLDYGLTVEEILFADERDLNKWASLKKVTSYMTDAEELEEKRRYEMKSKHKLRALPSLVANIQSLNSASASSAKGGDSKATVPEAADEDEQSSTPGAKPPAGHKRKRKHKKKNKASASPSSGDAATAAAVAGTTAHTSTSHSQPVASVKSEPTRRQSGASSGSGQQQKHLPHAEQPAGARKRRPRKRRAAAAPDRPDLSESRLRAYGIDPRKYHYLPLHKNKNQPTAPAPPQPPPSKQERAAARGGVPPKKAKRDLPPPASRDADFA